MQTFCVNEEITLINYNRFFSVEEFASCLQCFKVLRTDVRGLYKGIYLNMLLKGSVFSFAQQLFQSLQMLLPINRVGVGGGRSWLKLNRKTFSRQIII